MLWITAAVIQIFHLFTYYCCVYFTNLTSWEHFPSKQTDQITDIVEHNNIDQCKWIKMQIVFRLIVVLEDVKIVTAGDSLFLEALVPPREDLGEQLGLDIVEGHSFMREDQQHVGPPAQTQLHNRAPSGLHGDIKQTCCLQLSPKQTESPPTQYISLITAVNICKMK